MTHSVDRAATTATTVAPRTPPGGRSVRLWLVAGFVLSVLIRAALTPWRRGPIAVADEIGYLINARVVAGGSPSDLSAATFYRGGSSLFMAPIARLHLSPDTTYRLTIVWGSVIAGLTFLLLYALLRALLPDLSVALLLVASFLGASVPAVVSYSQLTTSESYLTPAFAAWLWVLVRMATGRRGRAGDVLWPVVLGVLAGLMWAIHSRTEVILGVEVLALLVPVLRRRDRRLLGPAVAVVSTGVAVWAADRYDGWLQRLNYPTGGDTVTSGVLHRVQSLRDAAYLIERAAGILWAAVVGSYGLVALGLVAAAGWWVRARWTRPVTRDRRTDAGWTGDPLRYAAAVSVVALIGTALGVSLLELGSGVLTAQYFFYQRYIDYLTPLFVAFAVVVLVRAGAARLVTHAVLAAAVTAVLLLPAWVLDARAISAKTGNPLVTPGLSAVVHSANDRSLTVRYHPWSATLVAVVALAVLTGLCVLRGRAAAAGRVTALVGVAGAFAYSTVFVLLSITLSLDHLSFPTRVTGGDLAVVRNARQLGWTYSFDPVWLYDYRFFYPGNMFVFPDNVAPAKVVDVVLAPPGWPGARYGFRAGQSLPDDTQVRRVVWTRVAP